MKLFTFLYSIYGLIVFSSLWIFFSIPFLMGIWFKRFLNFSYWCHHIIARFFFTLIFIPVKIKLEKNVDLKKQYIIISNHFSYIDIPSLASLNIPFKFIGKIQVNNIPLLGYIFKNLHIMVNREDKNSRKNTYLNCFKSIDEGHSIGIFPEGGIKTKKIPELADFKDGAFAMAIEKQISILPVSLLDAYKIMKGSFLLSWSPCKIVCHNPISPKGYEKKDIDKFKKICFDVLQKKLNESHKK
jgi:1-acyl-sn-glycerol-3-phosphate acyltransferase|tara:strand:+ start:738 stop:1463 length:726 start_codon:yes stop_codon:yes gene_type:complete